MDIGVGLPSMTSGTPGSMAIRWAVEAEDAGFSSLSVLDRLAYPIYEPLALLSAVASATTRVRLMANVLLAPTRETFMLAKQAATIQSLSDGRLVLGLGVGRRRDDYDVVAMGFGDRGRRFDGMLEQLDRMWRQEDLMLPAPIPPVPLMIGGQTDATVRRVAKWGVGWTSGGSRSLPDVAAFAARVREAWWEAGREGQPRILALSYFSIGSEELSRQQTLAYYGFIGPRAQDLAAAVPHDEEGILAIRDSSAGLGIDELTFIPTVSDIDQVKRLARIVFD